MMRERRAVLNRTRLQDTMFASTVIIDQLQACLFLGLSGDNPSATMKQKEGKKEVLRFTIDGRAAYPLFQFDVKNCCIFPAIIQLIAMKPRRWSDFRLLHWLTRPHLELGGTPGEALATDPHAIIAAFDREIEPMMHG